MFPTLRRPYKERTPAETTAVVRDILERHGLQPALTFNANPFPQVYSVSLQLDAARGGFRSNGKGRTPEYCLASAYAEFIERLQNGLYIGLSRVLQSQLQREFGFYYSPDEHFLTREEFQALPAAVIRDLVRYRGESFESFVSSYFERLAARQAPGAVAVPFYSSATGKTVLLPFNLLVMCVGSNGMAAGNSREEALFQAMCELLERWGAAEVFYRQLTPPTIPDNFLRLFEQEHQVIQAIQASGKYRVTVKDFSAGRRIPAVGLIIENLKERTYRLNVGSDTCFQVALSRCLTEVFQGFVDQQMLDQRLLKIPEENPPYFQKADDQSLYARYVVFSEFTKDNSGVFPTSLFAGNPGYDFDPATFTPCRSYRDEVRRLLEFFHGEGHDVYIRDVSYLGFPSVFVYAPEISALGRKNAGGPNQRKSFDLIEWDKVEEKICGIKTLPKEELPSVASSLEAVPPLVPVTQLLNLKLRDGSPWSQLPAAFLLAQLWYKAGKPAAAARALGSFTQALQRPDRYYDAVSRYLTLRAAGVPTEAMRSQFPESEWPQDVVQQVCDDLANPNEVLTHVRLPGCPKCPGCELQGECITSAQLAIARTLYPIMKQNMPEQGPHLAA